MKRTYVPHGDSEANARAALICRLNHVKVLPLFENGKVVMFEVVISQFVTGPRSYVCRP